MTIQTHAWHTVRPWENGPEVVNAVIEIPTGSKAKYELHKESGLLRLDRMLFSAVHYPANYGFIPQTYCDDGDPLDVLVFCSVPLQPMSLVEAKVIGVMRMLDESAADDKIIAVANNDMSVNYINDLPDLPPHTTAELRRFFEDYKKLENKHVTVESFLGREKAQQIVIDSCLLYQEMKAELVR